MLNNYGELGMRFLSDAAEIVKKSVDDLVEKQKITKDEGKSFYDNFMSFFADKSKDFEDKFASTIQKIIELSGSVPYSELEKLKRRVSILEKILK